MAELAKACAKTDIKFAFYFNLETWLNEGDDLWNAQGMSYPEYIEGQLTELLSNYGPVALVWFDHGHETLTHDRMIRIRDLIKRLQPDCLINNRGTGKGVLPVGDYLTPEREFPESDPSRGIVIECCDAMGVRSWGYHKQEAFWSVPELAGRVSTCASRGYNYLLNVEPAPDGSIRRECRVRARSLGAWIAKHRPALTARPSAIVPVDPNIGHHPPLGVCTASGNTLHLHLHQWPVSDEVLLPVSGTLRPGTLKATAASAQGVVIGGLPPAPPSGPAPWIVSVDFTAQPVALLRDAAKPLEPDPAGGVFLSPADAARESANGVLILKLNRYPDGRVSMGSLHKLDDRMIWHVNLPEAQEMEVHAAFGSIKSQDNAGFELTCGSSALTGRTWLTEHWSKPVRKPIGRIRLDKGTNRLVFRTTDMPNGGFSDVHGLWLIPR
jgi:alpha-L-fucosidase